MQYAGKSSGAYGICIVKSKIENDTNFTDCTSKPNLT
jgi:hypothetical protein